MKSDCIFCKIASGEISSYTVYEDDVVKAFFDISSASEGHTLVIPKKHYNNIYDIQEQELKYIISVVKKLAIKYRDVLGVEAVNILNSSGEGAQQDVPHFHFHLIPRKKNDDLDISFNTQKKTSEYFNSILEKINGDSREI